MPTWLAKFKIRKVIIALFSLLLISYCLLAVSVYYHSHDLFFPRTQPTGIEVFEKKLSEYHIKTDKITLTSSYGTADACLIPARSETNLWVIYLPNTHQQYYDEHGFWRHAAWINLSINILSVNYIELSSGVSSSEKMYQTSLMAYNYLTSQTNVSPEKIIVYGAGLGAYPAARLSKDVRIAALIIENSLSTSLKFLQDVYPFLPILYLVKEEFNISQIIADAETPSLFVVSEKDKTFPKYHTIKLYEQSAGFGKRLVRLKGNSEAPTPKDKKAYQRGIADFLKYLKLRII